MGPAPLDLTDFQVARAFWQQCGIPTEPPLDEWDIDRVARWLTVMEVVTGYEQAMAEREAQRHSKES